MTDVAAAGRAVGCRPPPVTITWDDQKIAVARLALSQLSYATDTGAERGVIAEMLADLTPPA